MSTYTIIKTPHPLDKVWEAALKELDRACSAYRDAPDDIDDEADDILSDARYAAIDTVMALPARNIADVLAKIGAAGHGTPAPIDEYPLSSLINEATAVIDAAVARGRDKVLS